MLSSGVVHQARDGGYLFHTILVTASDCIHTALNCQTLPRTATPSSLLNYAMMTVAINDF